MLILGLEPARPHVGTRASKPQVVEETHVDIKGDAGQEVGGYSISLSLSLILYACMLGDSIA